MSRCSVCNGRTVSTETGDRCMNPACKGSKADDRAGIVCECGGRFEHTNTSPYGDRTYTCPDCKETKVY